MLLLLSLLSVLIAAKNGKGYGHGPNFEHEAHGCHSESFRQQIQLTADSGYYEFEFGEAGTFALQNFIFYATSTAYLQVFDCFCGGDRFAVYDNGVWIATADEGCNDAVANCNPYSSDPETCYMNGAGVQGWCRIPEGGVQLNSGPHNITIQVLVNYYRTGKGYLYAYTPI